MLRAIQTKRLRILLATKAVLWGETLSERLTDAGHDVAFFRTFNIASKSLISGQWDCLIASESLETPHDCLGIQLARLAFSLNYMPVRSRVIHTILHVPVHDSARYEQASRTGASVIMGRCDVEDVVAEMRLLARVIVSDSQTGPMLLGIHRFTGETHRDDCNTCHWENGLVKFGFKEPEVDLPAKDLAILNCFMMFRKGFSPEELVAQIYSNTFLRRLLRGESLVSSAIKMRIHRIRERLGATLQGLPGGYTGFYFVPGVRHGYRRYKLGGRYRVIHVPVDIKSSSIS
jgi:hypothetical protein